MITDFGLARRSAHDDRTSVTLLTDTPEISGTPAYMAPEQVEGGPVTPATDIYALGVVLFEMVTGTWPFMARDPASHGDQTPAGTAPEPADPRARPGSACGRRRFCVVWLVLRPTASPPSVMSLCALEGGPQRADASRTARARRWRPPASWLLPCCSRLTLGGAYFVYARFVRASAADGITSLAVLPFANTSRDPQQEYLSDGISESLINRLSQLPGLKVVANSSSSRYKGKDADPQEVARALGVAGVLAGRVLQRGDSVSISVELIDGRDRTQVWGEQYVRKAADLLQVQAEISREIARKLQLRLTPGQQQRLATRDVRNPEAYELLLKGHFYRAKGGAEDRKKAGDYFARAIAVDPGYALAHADLSDIYRSLVSSSLVDPAEYLPKARTAARTALELDDNLAEAHYALANLMTYAWEWADAEREYKRAIALNPNLALAHRWYASYLGLVGRHDEAIAEIMRARELDPLSPGRQRHGGIRPGVGSSIRAVDCRAAEDHRARPDLSVLVRRSWVPPTRPSAGTPDAIAAYQKAITLGLDTPATQIALGAAYAQAGDHARARAVLARLQSRTDYVSPGELAILLAALGERDEAFASLEKAHAAHDLQLQYLGVSAGFDPLRSDPRFQDLLRRVGLAH